MEATSLEFKITWDALGDHMVRDGATDAVLFTGSKRECFGYVREAKGLGPMPEARA